MENTSQRKEGQTGDPKSAGSGEPGGSAASPFEALREIQESFWSRKPSAGESLGSVFRCARPVWSPGHLLPLWLLAIALWGLWSCIPAGEPTVPSAALRAAAGGLTVLASWLIAGAWISRLAWEYGRGERIGLAAGLRFLRKRWKAILGGPLLVACGAIVFIGIPLGGTAALAMLPRIGKALAAIWMLIPGIPLCLIASGIILLGVPALPLILAAGAVENPYPFDAASRGMSFVRARPCRYLGLLGSGLLGSLAGTSVFAVFLAIFLGILLSALDLISPGFLVVDSPAGLAREVLRAADPCWPLPVLASSGEGSSLPGLPALLCALVGRAVTAFAAASALSAISRIYLLLRWEVDGDPPGAQVRPEEEFEWS